MTTDLITVIMAAGKGTRMGSELPKVLHPLAGRPMIRHVLQTAQELNSRRIIIIIGHGAELIREELAEYPVEFVNQDKQLGTGHAVYQTTPLLKDEKGTVLVLAGDTPLISPDTLERLIRIHRHNQASASVLTAEVIDPVGLGRIIRGRSGSIQKIVEEKDATEAQKRLQEINTSTYCYEPSQLIQALSQIKPENNQGEFYLTDTIEILRNQGYHIADAKSERPEEILGVNTQDQLAKVESIILSRGFSSP